jgi:DNA-binding protein H-NS
MQFYSSPKTGKSPKTIVRNTLTEIATWQDYIITKTSDHRKLISRFVHRSKTAEHTQRSEKKNNYYYYDNNSNTESSNYSDDSHKTDE